MGRFGKFVTMSAVLLTVACGGGGDSTDDVSVDDLTGGDSTGDAVTGDDGGDVGGDVDGVVEVVGAPTVTVGPGLVVVEVDGQVLEFPFAAATYPTCEISPDSIQVNLQQTEAGDFALIASSDGDSWFGSITVGPSDSNASYGADLVGGRFGIGDDAISYEGPMSKVVDFDVVNAESVDATVAVNCESPGGDPTAMVGDQAYSFPMSGAQGIECTVSADEFEIRINRLAVDDLQLEMQGRHDGTQWVGAVVVYAPGGNSTAPLPLDGTGLVVDGGTVTFDGTFTDPDGNEVAGSATATCFE